MLMCIRFVYVGLIGNLCRERKVSRITNEIIPLIAAIDFM